jgi:hypothetical protein
MSKIFKALGLTVGIAAGVVLLLLGILMSDWGGSSDSAIAQAGSPDNQFVAEIHVLTTGMHGGPDKLYVTLRRNGLPVGEKIYERTYECDDFRAFHLRWNSAHELTITYGDCNAERERAKGIYREFNYRLQNTIWQSDSTWEDVKINYQDSKIIALH